jgi:peptidyl-prolyl cis-trans isomerase C
MPPRLTIKCSFNPYVPAGRRLNPPECAKADSNVKKRPENGSGRKDEGQIRGGRSDVNVAAMLPGAPNSATFRLVEARLLPDRSIVMSIKHPRAALAGIGLAVGISVLSVISAGAQETAPAPAAPAAPAQTAPDPATVVATVNGQSITEADLTLAEADLDQQFSRLPPEQRRAAALSALIEIRLLASEAEAKGLDKDPEFERRMAFLQQRALHSAVIDSEISSKITDDEIRKRYDTEMSNTPPVNEVKARHILVKTKEEADAIIKQLDAGGDFEKLANENTTDPSGKETGGDLGYFGPGQMVPEFEKAAFALDVGAYSKEPVQSQFGFHIIKVEDKRAQQPPAFDQVKDQIRSILLRENYFALVKSLRGAAKVDIADAELKKAVEQVDGAQ